VELLDAVGGGERERVSTSVTLGEGGGESAGGVEWLMNVSHIMNEKSQVEAISQVPRDNTSVLWGGFVGIFQSGNELSLAYLIRKVSTIIQVTFCS
jgi:hypothetical protein